MTHILKVRNVNHALVEGLWWLKAAGVPELSRNGPVLVAPGPVITEYTHPTERVLYHPVRDANAVFHLLESLWMLAGRNDAASLLPFNSNMANYAEADGTFHGAYGYRWRRHFDSNQLNAIAAELRDDPQSRRAVLGMWDPYVDLNANKKDLPCNTHAYFDLRGGALNMTVCCRSNDAVWGAYGANAVHFSILQEVLAHTLCAPVGVYRQMSNNFHVYLANPQVVKLLDCIETASVDPYLLAHAPPVVPLLLPEETMREFLLDCQDLFVFPETKVWRTQFFATVAYPLMNSYLRRKLGDTSWELDKIADCDWKAAFAQWVVRRMEVTA